MNSDILEWINETLTRLGISIVPLASDEARRIVANAKETFVVGNPRAWWMSLRGQSEVFNSRERKIKDILPSHENSYWFIPETEADDLPVFDMTSSEIEAVLAECPFFEYYVLDKKNSWLVAESDHDQFHVIPKGRT
jgi:hypothetical protein